MKAMDVVVPSRVIQDLIHFPHVVFLAFRTDNLKHSPSPIKPNLTKAIRLVKEISGCFYGGEYPYATRRINSAALLSKNTNGISPNK
jgi:hypothetical protein